MHPKRTQIFRAITAMGLLSDMDCRRAKVGDELHDGGNLVLRIGAKRRTWTLVWRNDGRVRKARLGQYPVTGLAAARVLAADGMSRVRQGLVPISLPATDTSGLPQPKPPIGPTVESILRTYVARHVRLTARAPKQIEDVIDRQLKPLHPRAIDGLSRRDITCFLDAVADERGSSSAYQAGTILRAALRFGVRRGDLDHDPMHLVGLPPGGKARERVLTDAEVGSVWRSQVPTWSRLARVLLLTGLRLREAANSPTAEIGIDFWQIPAARMKGARPHVIPMTSALRAELGEAAAAKWLFRSPRRFDQPASGFYRGIEVIHRETKTAGWIWHDLRRTAASGLQRLGAPSEVIEAILAHRRPGVSAVYQRHEYLPERREWLEKWAARVASLSPSGSD